MAYHADEIPQDIGFSLTGLLPIKLRYNNNCPFLTQSKIADFQQPF